VSHTNFVSYETKFVCGASRELGLLKNLGFEDQSADAAQARGLAV